MSNTSLQTELNSNHNAHIISDLVSGRLVPGPIWKKRNYRIKFLLRSLLFWSSTNRMLTSLSQRPDFSRLLDAQITLPSKSHRQYLTLGLNASQRADAIISHYAWLDEKVSPKLAEALSSPVPVQIIEFTGKDDAHFSVYASCASKAEREGETTLWMYDGEQTLLASVTFSVVGEEGHRALVIGGLQGPRRSVSHEVIKVATRACHGIFPKKMLLEVLSQISLLTGVSAMYGVSDNGHVFRALRYRLSKGRHFHASYDEFWASIEGEKESAWRWRLPVQFARKPLEAIASKKRAEYRRRFELLDDVIVKINHLFAA
ncbi:VirK/YbjX family protein [Kosakonia pseudosacchari]|uniref:VirK/YbjX family protein n=1 Tax=Kosakonia pseudosacchari TaxID=1646340 RepID=UPI000A3AAAD3|nr:VirK/YbjX family protein [Kosakonia pseudosacchari]